MKRAIFLLVVFGMGLFLMGFPVKETEAAPKIVLKAVSAWPVSHTNNDYYKIFMKQVMEKSNGEIEIQFLGGPEVVSVFDQLKAASTGLVDMINSVPTYYSGIVPEGTITDLIKAGNELKGWRESGVMDLYTQAYLEKGKVVFLGYIHAGQPLSIMTVKPVSKLADIRGMKLRSVGGLCDVFLGQLGASVVKIASAETYEGLQRGVVDGAIRNMGSLFEFKEYEVMKYIIMPSNLTPCGSVFVGEQKWKTIPPNLQKMMKETAIQAEADAYKYYTAMDRNLLKEVVEKHGMKVVNIPDEEIKAFHEARAGEAAKRWIFEKAPKYGPTIYEKLLPYIK